ncbi:hypothetical protein NL676_013583 [Syzygium grande]|nr:hypothetical protein NL676_013583 [Syzygium grande]
MVIRFVHIRLGAINFNPSLYRLCLVAVNSACGAGPAINFNLPLHCLLRLKLIRLCLQSPIGSKVFRFFWVLSD